MSEPITWSALADGEKANETIHTLAEVTDYGEGHNGLIRKF